jgi:hypothetical protein
MTPPGPLTAPPIVPVVRLRGRFWLVAMTTGF